jgi:hypothetical protein
MTAEERRNLIVRTAIGLFARQGFRGTRNKDIADIPGRATPDLPALPHEASFTTRS